MQDFQRKIVYNWENGFIVNKLPKNKITPDLAQVLVNHMWETMEFVNPPCISINNRYKNKSTGNRYDIQLHPAMVDEHTVVHELAHSVNLKEDRKVYDHHGPNFVADYCFLLHKFYKIDVTYLLYTLTLARVKVNKQLLMSWIYTYQEN